MIHPCRKNKPQTNETLCGFNALELGKDNLSPVEELHISHILTINPYSSNLNHFKHLMVVDEIVADIHIRCLPHVLDVLSKATHLNSSIRTFQKNQ